MGSPSASSLGMEGSQAVRPAPRIAFPGWRFLAASSPMASHDSESQLREGLKEEAGRHKCSCFSGTGFFYLLESGIRGWLMRTRVGLFLRE